MARITIYIIILLLCLGSVSYANDWEKVFTAELMKGRTELTKVYEGKKGLGYTRSEEVILQDAIQKAIDNEGQGCQILKISMDLEYSPYFTLKHIYGSGGDISIDQLCTCATEKGIKAQIISQAAVDAVTSDGDKRFQLDEVAQAQCFTDRGLGYTEALDAPPRIEPPEQPVPFSVSSPTN